MADALLIIDFQNDFVPGGALAVPDGARIAERVRELVGSGRFDLIVATRDWHPADHRSFKDQGGPWPPHCVQNTAGAELHPSVDRERVDVVIDKGFRADLEGYSAFEETQLEALLRERGIDRVTVVGLATDVCVRATALQALERGFEVTIDEPGVRGIDAEPGDSRRALDEIRAAGGDVASPSVASAHR